MNAAIKNYSLFIIQLSIHSPIFAAQKIDLNGKPFSNQERRTSECKA